MHESTFNAVLNSMCGCIMNVNYATTRAASVHDRLISAKVALSETLKRGLGSFEPASKQGMRELGGVLTGLNLLNALWEGLG